MVWPEVPAPLYYYEDAHFRDYVDTLARAARDVPADRDSGAYAARRAAEFGHADFARPGRRLTRYDKVNLVPFGEFVPVAVRTSPTHFHRSGRFRAGESGSWCRPLATHQIGTFICYESVFPNFVRQFATNGADLLFTISNDGWFGKSAAREQHLSIVRMRAAENRRWILRSTNDGITATIDPAGRVRGDLPLYVEATSYTGFNFISQQTLYTRFGDWFRRYAPLSRWQFDWVNRRNQNARISTIREVVTGGCSCT